MIESVNVNCQGTFVVAFFSLKPG